MTKTLSGKIVFLKKEYYKRKNRSRLYVYTHINEVMPWKYVSEFGMFFLEGNK